jgi:hypothetical protein
VKYFAHSSDEQCFHNITLKSEDHKLNMIVMLSQGYVKQEIREQWNFNTRLKSISRGHARKQTQSEEYAGQEARIQIQVQ